MEPIYSVDFPQGLKGEWKVWGWVKEKVEAFLGKAIPGKAGERLGTIALACGLPKDKLTSTVELPEGQIKLDELVRRYPEAILGLLGGEILPFYVKFLFINKDPVIWVGLREDVDIDEVIKGLTELKQKREEYKIRYQATQGEKEKGRLLQEYLGVVNAFCDRCFNRIDIKEGERHRLYLESGVIHAAGYGLSIQVHIPDSLTSDLGGRPKDEAWLYGVYAREDGFMIVEPQQDSNDTFQIVLRDLERDFDEEGFQKGIKIIRETDKYLPRGEALLNYLSDYPKEKAKFTFETITISPNQKKSIKPAKHSPMTLVVYKGKVKQDTPAKASAKTLGVGDWVFLPYAFRQNVTLANETNETAEVIRVYVRER